MDQLKSTQSLGSQNKDFAALMKIHHMGAIEMARLEVSQGTDQDLKAMAQKIVRERQNELQQLDAFLSNNNETTPVPGSESAFYSRVMKEAKEINMSMDNSGSVDQQFAQMMIPHHQGGIAMANLYLKSDTREERLQSIAIRLVSEQQKEIQQLQAWLAK
jgi:uncharacterized protein (DUF305 family)